MPEGPKLVGVREFRERLHTFTEPVTVVHTRGEVRVLGTWTPADWVDDVQRQSVAVAHRTLLPKP